MINPEPVQGWIIIIVAAVAVVLNTGIALTLRAGSSDINIRSTFVHMMGDAISAFGVIIAGVAILLTGWQFLDPLVSFLIGLFILWSSWGIIKEAVNVLMEGTPPGVNLGDLIADMSKIEGVQSIHDLHVWTIGHDKLALSAHVNTGNCSVLRASELFIELNELLEVKYDIVHSTLQPECIDCDPNDRYCSFHFPDNDTGSTKTEVVASKG
jgi:cobalt-zinc-cadmium efflux system protein